MPSNGKRNRILSIQSAIHSQGYIEESIREFEAALESTWNDITDADFMIENHDFKDDDKKKTLRKFRELLHKNIQVTHKLSELLRKYGE